MQHFRCHRKRRQVCSFLSLVRREEAGRWRLLNTKVTTNFSGWLCFALCFQCSISLDKSSFQIRESRCDVSAVGHLWCLIHFFCNFWLKAFAKVAGPRCHLVFFSALFFGVGAHGHKCARRICSSQAGCASHWITEYLVVSQSTTGDQCKVFATG